MTIEEVLALHNADIHTNRTFSGLMCRNIAVPIHEPASPPGSRLIRGVFFLTLHTEPRFPPPCEPTRTQTSATRHTQPSSTRVTQQTELLGCCSGVFPGSHFALECVSVRQLAPLTNHHCVHDSCAEAHRLTSKSPSRASSFSHLSVPLEREPLPRRAPNPTHTLRSHPPRRTACAAPSQTLAALLEQPSTPLLVRERMVLVCAAVVAMTGGDAVTTFVGRAVALASAPAVQSQVTLCQRQRAVCHESVRVRDRGGAGVCCAQHTNPDLGTAGSCSSVRLRS